jgi:hypothetical protein
MTTIREEPAYRDQMLEHFRSRPGCKGTKVGRRRYWDRAHRDRCRYFVVDEHIVFEGGYDEKMLRAPWYYEEHLKLFEGHRMGTVEDGLYCQCGSNTFRVFRDRDQCYETIAQCSNCGAESVVHSG